MINLALSLAAALLTGILLTVTWLSPLESIIPALAVGVGAFFFLARRTGRQLEAIMLAAQKDLMAQRVDKAIATMESARPLGRRQFYVEQALNSQIGAIHFLREDFNKALPLLQNSDARNWVARTMLAVLHYRKKDLTKMDAEFEMASRFSKKQGLMYSVWAWCHWKQENNEKAIQILARGDKELEGKDERLKQNLQNLQNGKKMKMKGYNEQWYQFHLEKPQVQQPQMRYRR
jgi:hypothetical protein